MSLDEWWDTSIDDLIIVDLPHLLLILFNDDDVVELISYKAVVRIFAEDM